MKQIGVSCAIGVGTLILIISYLIMTPLKQLQADGEYAQNIKDFRAAYKDIRNEYGYYDFDEMDVIPGEVPVVYFNQADPAWANSLYDTRSKKTQTIRSGGCGPTSLAIVYSSLKEDVKTPADMAEFAMTNGYCAAPQGSYRSLFTRGAEQLGLKSYYAGDDLEKALSYLSDGCLVVSLMGPGIFCDCGHFVVIRGITEEGKILVADCWNKKNNEKEFDINVINENLKKDGHQCLWVIGIGDGENER